MTDHEIFYPQALPHDLVFGMTLTPASHVVIGSGTTKLVHKLTNIRLECEMVTNNELVVKASSGYRDGKEFAYDCIKRETVKPFDLKDDTHIYRHG